MLHHGSGVPRVSRLAFTVLLAIPLALLALAPAAGRAAAHPAHPLRPATGKSSGPAVDLTLHYHSALAGLNQPERMATDAQGNVYVSDVNLNRVLMFDANDNFVRYFGTGTVGTGNGQFNGPAGTVVSGGNVYVADTGNHRIQVFTQSTGVYASQFGIGFLTAPDGMALASNSTLYVADSSANAVVEFNINGTHLGSFGGPGSGDGQFSSPVAVAASPFGALYVVDLVNTRVQQFTLAGAYVSQWGHTSFSTPDGVAVDRSGMVYVSDRGANTVYKFDPGGSLVGSYAAPATSPFVQGTFVTPADVAVSSIANRSISVYVSDQSAGVVQRFDQVLDPQLHTYQAQFGTSGTGNGQFNFPWGVAVDNVGNVFVVDSHNNRIEKFDQFGKLLLTFGGHGSADGQLSNPASIAVSPDGATLYVADDYNQRIEEFTTAGGFAGTFGTGGSNNGQFSNPEGVATDGSFVYVADTYNNRIQVFDTSGTYQYQFGSGPGSGSTQFNTPTGVAVDIARQELFIADYGNNRVQVYTTGGSIVASLTTTGSGTFNFPSEVSTDQRGDVYITDSSHDQIVEYDVNTTRVTSFGATGSGNGQFNLPFGVAISPASGQIYVADAGNNRVQRFGSPWPKNDTVGIYRPSTKTFYLRNANSTGPANITVPMPYAQTGDLPVVGDWNGDGVDTVGLYRQSTGVFLLQDANVQESAPDYTFTLGNPGDTPIAGDWNGQGFDGAGIFRPSNGILYLKNSLSTGYADEQLVLGVPGDKGIAGDWNGDGQDSPGVYRPSNQTFYVTNKVTNGIIYADATAVLGVSGDAPFTSDWVAQGASGIGVFRPSNGRTYEKNAVSTGFADNTFTYGIAGDYPVAGQWVAPSVPFTAPPPHVSLGTHASGSAAHSGSGDHHPTSRVGTASSPRDKPAGVR